MSWSVTVVRVAILKGVWPGQANFQRLQHGQWAWVASGLGEEREQADRPEAGKAVEGALAGTQPPFSAPAVVLVMVFGICWAPFHIDRLMWSFVSEWTKGLDLAFQYVHVISGVFFYLSSAVNPVLYSLMSSRFRETFWEALCLGTRCRRHRPCRTSHTLSRVATGSTLCDMVSLGSRAHPLAENGGSDRQQETDPS